MLGVLVALALAAPQPRLQHQPNLPKAIGDAAPLFAFANSSNYQGYPAYTGLPAADGCYPAASVTGIKGEALTFTRATTRFCPTSANEATGVMCASGEVCITSSGTTRGISIFRAGTNLALRSEEICDAAWADLSTPACASNAYVFADGATTMDTITDNDAAAFEGRAQLGIATTSETKHTLSCWLRCATGTCEAKYTIYGTGNAAGDTDCLFTGLTTALTRKSCTTTASFGAGITAANIRVMVGDAVGDTGTMGVGGCQYEVSAPYSTPYVATAGASVTRNIESASLAVTYGATVETSGSAAASIITPWAQANGQNGWILGHQSVSRFIYFQSPNFLSYDGTANPSAATGVVANTLKRVYNAWTAGANASTLNGTTAWTMDADGFDDVNASALRVGEQSAILTGALDGLISDVCIDSAFARCR